MKKFLATAALCLAAMTAHAGLVTTQTYLNDSGSGVVEGGVVTYTDLGTGKLQIKLNNISTAWNAAITGLVFNVNQPIAGAHVLSFVDGLGNDLLAKWDFGLAVNNNLTPGNSVFDLAFSTVTGIRGGIYNSGVATNLSNVAPDNALITLQVDSPADWAFAALGDSWLRLQRTGADGRDSLKTQGAPCPTCAPCPDCSPTPNITVPEPGSLALIGLGCLGLFGVTRRKLK